MYFIKLILPVNDEHPVKRVKRATEVNHDNAEIIMKMVFTGMQA
jgi:hypothetical protein